MTMDETHRREALEVEITDALREIYDPDIPMNLVELGLIYRIEVFEAGRAEVDMTFTNPNCPMADVLLREVRDRIEAIPGVQELRLEVLWEPPWTPDRMSEAAMLELNLW